MMVSMDFVPLLVTPNGMHVIESDDDIMASNCRKIFALASDCGGRSAERVKTTRHLQHMMSSPVIAGWHNEACHDRSSQLACPCRDPC